MAFITSLMSTVLGLPPGFGGGMRGAKTAHLASLKSVAYLFLFGMELGGYGQPYPTLILLFKHPLRLQVDLTFK